MTAVLVREVEAEIQINKKTRWKSDIKSIGPMYEDNGMKTRGRFNCLKAF